MGIERKEEEKRKEGRKGERQKQKSGGSCFMQDL